MINAGMLLDSSRSHFRWTRDRSRVNLEEFVHCQVRANETYSEAKHQFTARNRDVLMNAQSAVVQCFGGLFVWIVSWVAGDRPM